MAKERNGTWRKIGISITVLVILSGVITAFVWTQADVKANASCNIRQNAKIEKTETRVDKVEDALIRIDTNLSILVDGYEK